MGNYQPVVLPMLVGQTTPGIGATISYINELGRAFSAFVDGTGAVAATFIFECSNDSVHWNETPLATITLSGTNVACDGFTTSAPWAFVRVRLTAISGTTSMAGANVAMVGDDT